MQELSIYDRWGNVIFRTTDINKGWDGTYLGKNLDTGTFVYLIKGSLLGKAMTVKGTVTLIR
ncbi:MAG: T9SS type B sorting domain-containing protein [Panacibacter sp.]